MGPRLPAGRPGDEREEKVVHDRGDPFAGHPLQPHQHVVPQQVERHLQDGGGEPVQVAFGVAFWWSVAFSLLAVLLSLWLPGAQRDRDRREPAGASPVPAAAGSGKIDT